jgi:hypothetical protein
LKLYNRLRRVGITTGYWLDAHGSIPGRVKRFISTSQHPDRLWDYPIFVFNLPLGVKQPGREVDPSLPSSAQVKEMELYTYLQSPILLIV